MSNLNKTLENLRQRWIDTTAKIGEECAAARLCSEIVAIGRNYTIKAILAASQDSPDLLEWFLAAYDISREMSLDNPPK